MTATAGPIRIVLVEDVPAQAEDVQEKLRGAFAGLEIEPYTCEFDFREALPKFAANPPSLFIIDMILRWTTPRVPLPAMPATFTPYRAGARCIRALTDQRATAKVPILIHSSVDPAGITELDDLPDNVMYARRGSDLPSLVRAVLQPTTDLPTSRRVFVVHGHNHDILEAVVNLLKHLDLEPVVLFDQAGEGKTFVELLERHADVDFAVVLLTADDIGRLKTEKNNRNRARQNVILELGYFIARLGRSRVCSVYEPGVEIPTDVKAVKYVRLDLAGTWKRKLAAEIRKAKLPIDVSSVL